MLKKGHADALAVNSREQELVVEGFVSNFEPRCIGRTLEGDNCG